MPRACSTISGKAAQNASAQLSGTVVETLTNR
jgi:hypothetical protein